MTTNFPNSKSVYELICLASDILKAEGSIRLGTLILATCNPAERNYKYGSGVGHLREKFAGLDESQQWRLYVKVLESLNDDHGPLDCPLTSDLRDSGTTWQKADPHMPASALVIHRVLAAKSGSLKERRDVSEGVKQIRHLREASKAALAQYWQVNRLLKDVTAQFLLG